MSNEPKAGKGIDPEMLAAYIDKRLPPDERAAVEAQLATDPRSYELLVELVAAQEALGEDAAGTKVPEVRAVPAAPWTVVPRVPTVPKVRVQRWVLAGGVLAAAAALVLVVRMQPDLLQRLRGGDAVDPQLAKLVAAVGEERYIEARLTGGFKYGPLRSVTRGPGDLSQQNLALLAAAGELQKKAQQDPNAANLHAWGVAQLMMSDFDGAVQALTEALAASQGDVSSTQSDLAAAYLARSRANGSRADAEQAHELARAASGARAEARFNLALALEALGRGSEARDLWQRIASDPASGEWREDARRHLSRPGTMLP